MLRTLRRTFRNDAELLNIFCVAETLGKTVDELLTGEPGPISNAELMYWPAYRVVKNELEVAANKKKEKKSGPEDGTGQRRTMGQK